jgi:hypothetical protein
VSAGLPWRWVKVQIAEWELIHGGARVRARIWNNTPGRYTWHTFDSDGTGGENDVADSLNDAKDLAVAAIVRQGWAPGGWKVTW